MGSQHLCAEEKTYSRNDTLTRHMGVVHPDVDWSAKTRTAYLLLLAIKMGAGIGNLQ